MRYRLGVDVGGTVTDLVLLAENSGLDTILDGANPVICPSRSRATSCSPSERAGEETTT